MSNKAIRASTMQFLETLYDLTRGNVSVTQNTYKIVKIMGSTSKEGLALTKELFRKGLITGTGILRLYPNISLTPKGKRRVEEKKANI